MNRTNYSDEYSFISTGSIQGRFADQGNSGSILFDEAGRAVGLLFSGMSPQQTGKAGCCLMTPIEDVFKDIKAYSKGQIVDIRIAQFDDSLMG